jgi:hypothetical protein
MYCICYGAGRVLIASLEMNLLVLMTVVPRARMYIYATCIVTGWATNCFSCVRLHWMSAVCGRILLVGYRHALEYGEAMSKFLK